MTQHSQHRIAAALLTFALLAVPALAASLADVEIGSTSVSFQSAGERLSLVVSGPQGFAYQAELRQGGLTFEIFDADGNLLPDGVYNYELKAVAGAAKAAERDNVRGLGEKSAERPVQSGVFTIAGGSLVDPSAEEPPARETPEKAGVAVTQKLVHAEDVKIQGSLCVGADCTSAESFGFDTVRLKENNLRIKFEDTSTGSFPSNDWQLTANDTTNGGANRFSIDDVTGGKTPFTIEAGAPSSSLYVADTGEIGVGTSTPASNIEIHVKDGNTPTLRLEQDGSSGFTAQTWDVAGNEANFFVRDVNHSSHLPFRIQPGSGNDNALYIASDGDIGLNTTSPAADLHIRDTGSASADDHAELMLEANGQRWKMRTHHTSGSLIFINDNTSNTPLAISTADRVDITGTLYINGVDNSTPDYVFGPGYELESIEDHADFMWANKHLPAVHPAQVDENGKTFFEVGARNQGVLEELEKAHIYIEQLHEAMKALESRLAELEGSND